MFFCCHAKDVGNGRPEGCQSCQMVVKSLMRKSYGSEQDGGNARSPPVADARHEIPRFGERMSAMGGKRAWLPEDASDHRRAYEQHQPGYAVANSSDGNLIEPARGDIGTSESRERADDNQQDLAAGGT